MADTKRPLEPGSGNGPVASGSDQPAPKVQKSVGFAGVTKTAVAASMPPPAAAAADSGKVREKPKPHRVGVPYELDGGYRCQYTGRWIGNGAWNKLWNGVDTGSWDGSHIYGVPEEMQAEAKATAAAQAAQPAQ